MTDKLDSILRENVTFSITRFRQLRDEEGLNEDDAYIISYGEGMRDFWNQYIENHDEIMSELKKYIN